MPAAAYTNPAARALLISKPFNIFHTHVIDRGVMGAAIESGKSLEVDIAITDDGSIYVGHPLRSYEARNLPPPNNLPLDDVIKKAKAAELFLVLDLKNVKVISKAREIIENYGAENCLVHAFCKELSFEPWPEKVKAEAGPCWKEEELPLGELLELRAATGVPLALSCHGITQKRLKSEEEEVLKQVIDVASQGVLAISMSMPPDKETPLDFANKLIEHKILPLIRFDYTSPQNRPEVFLGFTDHLQYATDPKTLISAQRS